MSNPKRILIVDDEEEILGGARIWFHAAGFDIKTARDGIMGIEEAHQCKPDAIVMDVRMPRKDGLTALVELSKHEGTRQIPVVMLSASIVDQKNAFDAGATCFLAKPYQGRVLVEAVTSAIEKRADRNASGEWMNH